MDNSDSIVQKQLIAYIKDTLTNKLHSVFINEHSKNSNNTVTFYFEPNIITFKAISKATFDKIYTNLGTQTYKNKEFITNIVCSYKFYINGLDCGFHEINYDAKNDIFDNITQIYKDCIIKYDTIKKIKNEIIFSEGIDVDILLAETFTDQIGTVEDPRLIEIVNELSNVNVGVRKATNLAKTILMRYPNEQNIDTLVQVCIELAEENKPS